MPKLHHQEKISPVITIGVQLRHDGYTHNKAEQTGNWSARIKYPKRTAFIRSLGIPYDGGNQENKNRAIIEAERLAMANFEKSQHTDPARPTAFRLLAYEWLRESESKMEHNESLKDKGLDPEYEIEGGKGYWTRPQYEQYARIIKDHAIPFFRFLKPGVDEACVITTRPQDLDRFEEFIRRNPTKRQQQIGRPVSPSTILKCISAVRHVYRYAYRQGIIDRIPEIKRPKAQLKARARAEIKDSEYKAMVKYTRAKYQDDSFLGSIKYTDGDGIEWDEKVTTYRDYQYLFHLWIMVIANCGIRPPTSGTEHTQIRWNHLKIDKKTGIATLRRPKEKNHDYTAVIMPSAVVYWEELRQFQKDRDIYREDGPVFAHPTSMNKKKGGWNKGDPISSFRNQWSRMLKDLGKQMPGSHFDADKSTPQSQKITPSSLRSWFITQRLRHGDVGVERLAGATGTNLDTILAHYYKFATEKEYDKLTKGGYERPKTQKVIRKDGYYIGHEDEVLDENGNPLKID